MTKPLSPAAQAVLDAVNKELDKAPWHVSFIAGISAAAALQTAADQVVPENAKPIGDEHDDARLFQWMRIRNKLRAIAAELEGHQ